MGREIPVGMRLLFDSARSGASRACHGAGFCDSRLSDAFARAACLSVFPAAHCEVQRAPLVHSRGPENSFGWNELISGSCRTRPGFRALCPRESVTGLVDLTGRRTDTGFSLRVD